MSKEQFNVREGMWQVWGMSGFQLLLNLMFLSFVFQKKAWHTIKTMVNLPVISPFKKRYSWVQLAGHTGETYVFSGIVFGVGMTTAQKTVFQCFSISIIQVKGRRKYHLNL